MSLEKTLVILKPSAVQRGLIGEITTRFERKGLRLAGMKMMQLTDELLNEHYAHLSEKPFFQRVKKFHDGISGNRMLLRRSGCDPGCAFHDRSNQRTRCHTGNNPGRLQCQFTGKYRSYFGFS